MSTALDAATANNAIDDRERARREHVITKLAEGDGPTINRLLPAREAHEIAGLYHEVISIADEDYKRAVRDHLSREETGLYLTSTPRWKIRLRGDPCPLDFRAFPDPTADTAATPATPVADGGVDGGQASASEGAAPQAPGRPSATTSVPAGDTDSEDLEF